MGYELFPFLNRASDANNAIYAGAKWYFYATGGLVDEDVFTTSALNVAHSQPVTADSAGKFAAIYLDAAVTYRAVLKNATGSVTIFDIDPVNSGVDGVLGSAILFEQPGANAQTSDLQAYARQRVCVLDYIPKSLHAAIRAGSDATNHTPYLQAMDTDGLDFLYFPAGVYNIDTAFVSSHNQIWQGEGIAATTINCGVNGYIVETTVSNKRISPRDIHFLGDLALPNSGCFKLFDQSGYGFHRCTFANFNREALWLSQSVQVNIDDCQIANCATAVSGTVTITNATPAVVTFTGHGLAAATPVVFTTTGALPLGITASRVYYVSATSLTANTFKIAATPGGSVINTTAAGSGVHTCKGLPYAGIYLDPGATANVQVFIRGGYISGCGIGIKASATRSLDIDGPTVESNTLGGQIVSSDGKIEVVYGEANTIDFDLFDCAMALDTDNLSRVYQTYSGVAFEKRALKNRQVAFIEAYSAADQIAGATGTWIDAVLGTEGNLYEMRVANNAATANYAGTYSAHFTALFRATTANIRNGAARLVHTPTNAVATVTIATPGVMTLASHGFAANTTVLLSTDGALPTGLTAGTTYYVRNPATDTFELSLTSGGASINTTGTQSGTHYVGQMVEVEGSYSPRQVSASLTAPVTGQAQFALPAYGKVKMQISVDNVDLTVSSGGISGLAAPTNATSARLIVEHKGVEA